MAKPANVVSFPGSEGYHSNDYQTFTRAYDRVMRDSLYNVVSGLGTSADKSTYTTFGFNPIQRVELDSAYRGDWVARKVVDIPAFDCTRAWRQWEAEADDITKIEDLEKEFDIQGKVQSAMIKARLYGGAALVLGFDDSTGPASEPLDVERVKEGSLKWVHAVTRWDLSPFEIQLDPNEQGFRLPKGFYFSADPAQMPIHISRVVRFFGNKLPDYTLSSDGWGDSILQTVGDAIKQIGSVAQNISLLVQEAKTDVISIPELSDNLSSDEYSSRLMARFRYAQLLKSTVNATVIDKEETWQRIQGQFAGLPDVLKMYMLIASGSADIPVTRFFSQSPTGMNATGESDMRNYYDKLSADQNTQLRPAMNILDEVLVRSAGVKPDPEITYNWNPLWQMTDAEKADIALKKVQVFTADVGTGLMDANALKEARYNQIIEDGTYPGFELILQAQEEGDIPTQEEEFAHDPEMNPDHPQNVANQEMALANAKAATKAANAPSDKTVPPKQ